MRRERRKAGDTQLLYEVGRLFSSTLDSDEVLNLLARKCTAFFNADFALVRLIENRQLVVRGSYFRLAREREVVEELLASEPIRVGEGIAGRVAQSGEPAVHRVKKLEQATLPRYVDFLRIREWVVVPMRARQGIVGVLTFIRRGELGPWSPEEIALAQGIADQAAVAAENARLFEKVSLELAEREKAEAALQAEKAFSDNALNSQSDICVVFDPEKGNALRWNRALREASGYSDEEIAAMRVPDDWFGEEDVVRAKAAMAEAARAGSATAELSLRTRDGRFVAFEFTGSSMDDVGSGRRLLVVTGRDMTERNEAESKLRLSEEKYRTVVEQCNDLIWTLDAEGKFTYFNKSAEKASGYPLAAWIGRSFAPLIPPEDLPAIEKIFRRTMQGETQHYEVAFVRRDGQRITLSVNTAPILESGKVVGTVSCGRDVTEFLKAEKDKELLTLQLHQAQKMEAVGRMAGGIAHDFNNVLTAIMGLSDVALLNAAQDEALRDGLEQIQKEVTRAAELSRKLLVFSRQQPMTTTLFDLNRTVLGMMEMLTTLLGGRVELKTELSDDLRPVRGDPGALGQVIMNLLINARDAMPAGGRVLVTTGKVRIDPEYCASNRDARPGEYARLAVRDEGLGIAPDILDRIFDPFFTTKNPDQGTGLGLAVVYGIVKQHGGWVSVETDPRTGSVFSVFLPGADPQ